MRSTSFKRLEIKISPKSLWLPIHRSQINKALSPLSFNLKKKKKISRLEINRREGKRNLPFRNLKPPSLPSFQEKSKLKLQTRNE